MNAFYGSNIHYIAQLPLFPRASETGETKLWNVAAVLREHLFQHGLLEDDQLFMLALMKGDKVVEITEICADLLLLSVFRNHNCFC